jgi:hypothetical protein
MQGLLIVQCITLCKWKPYLDPRLDVVSDSLPITVHSSSQLAHSLVRVPRAGRNNFDILFTAVGVHRHGTPFSVHVKVRCASKSLCASARIHRLQVFSFDPYLIESNMFTKDQHLFLYWSLVLSIIVATTLWLASCFTEVRCTQAHVSHSGCTFVWAGI